MSSPTEPAEKPEPTFNQHAEDPDVVPAFVLMQEQVSAAPGDHS